MPQKRFSGYLIGAFIILLGLYLIVAYNSLVRKEEKMEQTWADVQSTYQRRLDLTPNLVNTVKGMASFEQETLVQVTEARSNALSASGAGLSVDNYNRQSSLQDTLAAASNRLIAVIEKYPVLRGTEAYRGLQVQLEGNERRIKVARADFNAAVRDYNEAARSFPKSLVAKLFGFEVKEGFKAVAGAQNNVDIKF
ncbi:LemA family protein [Niabella sp. 22666]|jgi:LemA protein|uniref:LemA family protein n=1 Tax=Niabella sp. 22666 TaxID=3453954 RepID=UPI003F86EE4F